jgi:hypothetical protein
MASIIDQTNVKFNELRVLEGNEHSLEERRTITSDLKVSHIITSHNQNNRLCLLISQHCLHHLINLIQKNAFLQVS